MADQDAHRVHDAMVADLERPQAWPFAVTGPITRVRTHLSDLLFADDVVLKLKRPVRYAFVDFTDPAARRAACDDEVRLGRRLAPWVYHGVVPVTRDAAGRHRVRGEGEPVAWGVEMERLPAARMLGRLLDRGEVDNALLGTLAEWLAAFHACIGTDAEVTAFGAPDAVRALILGNLDELAALVRERAGAFPVGAEALAGVRGRAAAWLDDLQPLLARRARDGFVREGHGDLHADNVCITERGPVAYDPLEFSLALRAGDVAADLAFLVMDLDRRGFWAFSRFLVRAYAVAARDPDVARLVPLYELHRAAVRAKVDLIAGHDERALTALAVALRLAVSAPLVLTCGLPATGKSVLARRLAPALDAAVLRSDVVRKRAAGLAPTEHPQGEEAERLYAGARTDEVYAALCEQAVEHLLVGRAAIVDATFSARRHRRRFVDVATRLDHPVVVVHVTCDERVVAQRLAARAHDPAEVSDADAGVHARIAERFEPLDELDPTRRVTVRSGEDDEPSPAVVVARVLDALARQAVAAAASPAGGGAGTLRDARDPSSRRDER